MRRSIGVVLFILILLGGVFISLTESIPSNEKVLQSKSLSEAFGKTGKFADSTLYDSSRLSEKLKCTLCVAFGANKKQCEEEQSRVIGRFLAARGGVKSNLMWHLTYFLNSKKTELLLNSSSLGRLSSSLLPENVGPDLETACNRIGASCTELNTEQLVRLAASILSGSPNPPQHRVENAQKRLKEICSI